MPQNLEHATIARHIKSHPYAFAFGLTCLVAVPLALWLWPSPCCRELSASSVPAKDADVMQLNMATVFDEYRKNRPATLNKYVGKTVEIDLVAMRIDGGDQHGIRMIVHGSNASSNMWYLASFDFGDKRNALLKTVSRAGEYKGKVRGIVTGIEPTFALPDTYHIRLSPAWVEGDIKILKQFNQ